MFFCRKKSWLDFVKYDCSPSFVCTVNIPQLHNLVCLGLPASFNLSFAYLNGGRSNLLFEVCGDVRFCTSSIPNATDRENQYTPCASIFRSVLFSSHLLISTTSAHTAAVPQEQRTTIISSTCGELMSLIKVLKTSSLWKNWPKVIGFCHSYLFVSFLPQIRFKTLLHRSKMASIY